MIDKFRSDEFRLDRFVLEMQRRQERCMLDKKIGKKRASWQTTFVVRDDAVSPTREGKIVDCCSISGFDNRWGRSEKFKVKKCSYLDASKKVEIYPRAGCGYFGCDYSLYYRFKEER